VEIGKEKVGKRKEVLKTKENQGFQRMTVPSQFPTRSPERSDFSPNGSKWGGNRGSKWEKTMQGERK